MIDSCPSLLANVPFRQARQAIAITLQQVFLPRMFLIGLHDIIQRVLESVLSEQLPQPIAACFPDVLQNLRHHQAYALFLHEREQGPQRFRC